MGYSAEAPSERNLPDPGPPLSGEVALATMVTTDPT